MKELVLLGGPPGVGKSSTLDLLAARIEKSGVLEADDVWRVSTDIGTPENRLRAQECVIAPGRVLFDAGCERVIIAWVFARELLYGPVIEGFSDIVDSVTQLYLTASPEELSRRLAQRCMNRGEEVDSGFVAYALGRLDMINDLPFPSIDTTGLSPGEVADQVTEFMRR